MIYVCMNVFVMMECKKKLPFWVTLPSAMATTLGKAGKMGDQKTDFPALPSAVTMTLGKEIKKKLNFAECRP